MKPILITSYVEPDLDGTAGAIAYSEYLNKTGLNTVASFIGNPHEEADYVLKKFGIPYPNILFDTNDFNQIILVDASDLNGLEGKMQAEKIVEVIDHRSINEAEKFTNAKIQIELVGAAATLVAEKFIKNNIEISKSSAILLLSAIISNTLNFKGGITTDRDRLAYQFLNKIADLPEDYWKELFGAKSNLDGSKLSQRIVGDLAWFKKFGNKTVGIAQIEMIGGQKLVENRLKEITTTLEKIKAEKNFDFIFLNLIELADCFNIFITSDTNTKNLLEKILSVRFDGNYAKRQNLIMRKQIVPLIKQELEK